jgi:3'(2'), 5'-bisphosphate nucleotidase
MSYELELQTALDAARQAGQAILAQYNRFKAIADAPANITTDADREAQEIVLQVIQKKFPNDALCAEETTPTLAGATRLGTRQWVVDPIDGTRGFARKNGEFSVMIGFVDQGRSVLGIILEPALERLTYAVKGQGCWRQDGLRAEPVRCHVSTAAQLPNATVIQSRSQKTGPPSPHILALKPARTVETYSAGIKMARVARGEADLYLNNYASFHDWDICAGHIQVEEAGGQVTGLGGEHLQYGLPGAPQKSGLLASNGLIHEQAVKALREVVQGKQV